MNDPYRRPQGPPESIDRMIRAGFGAVIGRLERLAERIDRLEAELGVLRERTGAPRPTAPRDGPPEPPPPAPPAAPNREREPEPDPATHIDGSLIWGPQDGERSGAASQPAPAPPGIAVPDRFAAEVGERHDEGSGLSKLLRRRRSEEDAGSG